MARHPRPKASLEQYHFETIPPETERVLTLLAGVPWIRAWYLAGGTALALHYDHRSSVDLDFFTERKTFDEQDLVRNLRRAGAWKTTATDVGTLYGELHRIKTSFIAYPWFRPKHVERVGSLRILGPDDIAVMKVLAIAQRGRRRDFVDLYAYCQRGHALGTLLGRVRQQYSDRAPDLAHLLRSLVFFTDAEKDPPVRLVTPIAWHSIAGFFEREVRALGRRHFGL